MNIKQVLIAAVLVLILAACGGGARNGQQAASHACADKIAQATSSSGAVPGLWNCLDGSFQTKIKATGIVANRPLDAALSINVATSTSYLGGNEDFATYELVLDPVHAAEAGSKWVELTVYLSADGLVDNVAIAQPAF